MRVVIHDQESHNFIEGPLQSRPANDYFHNRYQEKVAGHADLNQGFEVVDDANESDMAFYQANERYD